MAAEESGQSCLESNLTVCKARASTCRPRTKNKSEQTSGEACVQQAYVAANDPHAWFCDLCSHGDVHPNPGPPSAIPIWSCNVGRGAGSWEFVKLGISQQIPIFAIQEVGLRGHELQALLTRDATHTGGRPFHAP